jgi:hypothetical protein
MLRIVHAGSLHSRLLVHLVHECSLENDSLGIYVYIWRIYYMEFISLYGMCTLTGTGGGWF